MGTALRAIQQHPKLQLQIVATGMHLDPAHGDALSSITAAGFRPDAVVPWPTGRGAVDNAIHTGQAIAHLARTLHRLSSDAVLVVGDRVEAFAGAVAAHLSHLPLAHVHGGDRALGQVDDSLRHAITKLAHIHFPATAASARRIIRLGEEPRRVFRVGSPGNDGIARLASDDESLGERFPKLDESPFALLVLHPTTPEASAERRRAAMVLGAVRRAGLEQVIIVSPNNDPGARGILAAWKSARRHRGVSVARDLPRSVFLGLLRDAQVLVGNSSSGIIEAAAFRTPVVDIGPRQAGRERSNNLLHVEFDAAAIVRALRSAIRMPRSRIRNVYAGDGAGEAMADILARLDLRCIGVGKLISY